MTHTPSKILPNSFQTPNFFVDECLEFLTGNEFKCLSFLARKTFGWQKRSDRIAKSQIATAAGLNGETVDKCMEALVAFGLVIRVAENNASNAGVKWALQTDDRQVHFDLLQQRQESLAQAHRQKTEKARQKRTDRGVGLSNNPTPETPSVGQKPAGGGIVQQPQGGIVQQPPQKPIKAKEKNMGAFAPAHTSATPEQRSAAFPEDCRAGAQLMFEVFNLIPPERPAAEGKGGDFALWINGLRILAQVAREYDLPLAQAMHLAHQHWNAAPFNLSHPGALKKTMTSVLAQARAMKTTAVEHQETPMEQKLKTFKPRGSA